MSLVGIITNNKRKKKLKEIFSFSKIFVLENIIYIKKENIQNLKNVKFDIVVLDDIVNFDKTIEKILYSAKYILINADLKWPKQYLKNLKSLVITYGYNRKATLTVSSNEQEETILFLQRKLELEKGFSLESQEIKVDEINNIDIYSVMITLILFLINMKK